MNTYIQLQCSCIICKEVKSVKGIHTHYERTHGTSEQKEKYTYGALLGGQRGGKALADICAVQQQQLAEQYYISPKTCGQCSTKILYEKRRNKFCSSSCSASYNNTGKIKVTQKLCNHCNILQTRGKFCSKKCSSQSRKKYKTDAEAKEVGRIRRNEASANYRSKLRNQTPLNVDRKAIKEFYRKCPKGYEVDHITPISKGGLHSIENLQYLTISENRIKGSKIL